MRRGVEWKALSNMPGGFKFVSRVCDKLDCGSVLSAVQQRGNSVAPKWSLLDTCDGLSLARCQVILRNTVNYMKITCSGKLPPCSTNRPICLFLYTSI